MPSIVVKTKTAEYPVLVRPRLLEKLAVHLAAASGKRSSVFIVTSPEIWALWGDRFLASLTRRGIQVCTLFIPAGERYKRLATVERLAEELSHAGAKRDALLVAFGGGVVGDAAGFLAAIYMRGIRYVQAPTTYLAQVDSSIGGKTGVNLRTGKNLIGNFHHPAAVLSDPVILSTLPAKELRAGLVESVKSAVLGDADYFRWLERHLDDVLGLGEKALSRSIETSARIKAAIVAADERESGQRMLLNLGHTVGHAIEAVTGYRTLLHGEAVAWGMIAALRLSVGRGALSASDARRVEDLLFRLGPFPRFRASADALVERTATDKKHLEGARRFVLPVRIGKAVVVEDVTEKELRAATDSMLRTMKAHPAKGLPA
jgi:3-dehydroquinate synthase